MPCVSLVGPSGSGKTALLGEWMHKFGGAPLQPPPTKVGKRSKPFTESQGYVNVASLPFELRGHTEHGRICEFPDHNLFVFDTPGRTEYLFRAWGKMAVSTHIVFTFQNMIGIDRWISLVASAVARGVQGYGPTVGITFVPRTELALKNVDEVMTKVKNEFQKHAIAGAPVSIFPCFFDNPIGPQELYLELARGCYRTMLEQNKRLCIRNQVPEGEIYFFAWHQLPGQNVYRGVIYGGNENDFLHVSDTLHGIHEHTVLKIVTYPLKNELTKAQSGSLVEVTLETKIARWVSLTRTNFVLGCILRRHNIFHPGPPCGTCEVSIPSKLTGSLRLHFGPFSVSGAKYYGTAMIKLNAINNGDLAFLWNPDFAGRSTDQDDVIRVNIDNAMIASLGVYFSDWSQARMPSSIKPFFGNVPIPPPFEVPSWCSEITLSVFILGCVYGRKQIVKDTRNQSEKYLGLWVLAKMERWEVLEEMMKDSYGNYYLKEAFGDAQKSKFNYLTQTLQNTNAPVKNLMLCVEHLKYFPSNTAIPAYVKYLTLLVNNKHWQPLASFAQKFSPMILSSPKRLVYDVFVSNPSLLLQVPFSEVFVSKLPLHAEMASLKRSLVSPFSCPENPQGGYYRISNKMFLSLGYRIILLCAITCMNCRTRLPPEVQILIFDYLSCE